MAGRFQIELVTPAGEEIPEPIRLRLHLSPIIRRFDSWAATTYGVESVTQYYPIYQDRLWEPYWVKHMSQKRWVYLPDFIDALDFAREYFKIRPRGSGANGQKIAGLSVRFRVFRRDGYRCQLCGRAADDGDVRLEVDHKVPRSRGGESTVDNLWTLCFDCNRGKRAEAL